MNLPSLLAVALGGALGAWSRWGLSLLLNPVLPPLPLGTLAANLIGGFLIGFSIEFFARYGELPPEARLFVITGFLGALTTYSTFSAEAVTLILRSQYGWAALHISTHLLGSIVMTIIGIATVRGLHS